MEPAVKTYQCETLGDGPAREALLCELECQLNQNGWSSSDIFGMQMVLEESVSNAYRHGNRNGELGNVLIQWQVSPGRFSAEIRDQGTGFDESQVPNPIEPENLDQLSGRGLLLMRGYMDSVEYKEGGRVVEMRKNRDVPTSE